MELPGAPHSLAPDGAGSAAAASGRIVEPDRPGFEGDVTGGHPVAAGGRLRAARAAVVVLTAIASGSCGNSLVREGRAASGLVIEQFLAASGADPQNLRNTLQSDVVTNVTRTIGTEVFITPTVFEDLGQVIARFSFKDPGTPGNPTTPTSANFITITRYRVVFRRADGRNTPGVDVPYPFDGATTFSVLDIGSTIFTLVRAQAKLEPPLVALRGTGGAVVISTIAEVTFFGHDQTGAEVKTEAAISVNFADWGDPL